MERLGFSTGSGRRRHPRRARSARSPGTDRLYAARKLEASAQVARRADRFERARELLEAAIDLAGDADPAWTARAHTQLSRLLALTGDLEASLQAARAAVGIAPDGASRSLALARIAVSICRIGDSAGALLAAREAMRESLHASDPETEGVARMSLGYALRASGLPAAAANEFRVATALAEAAGDHEAQVARLIDLADSLHLGGDGAGAVSAAGRAIAAARRGRCALGMPRATRAYFAFHLGQWQQASRDLDDGLRDEPEFPWLHLMRAQLLVGRGDLVGASHHLRVAETSTRGPRAGGWDGPQEIAAELALWRGMPDTALDLVQQALATIDLPERSSAGRRLTMLGLRAAADLRGRARGTLRSAPATADALIDLMRRHAGSLRETGQAESGGAQLLADEATAEAEYARARNVAVPEQWLEAALRHEVLNHPWDAGYARYRHAEAVLVGGGAVAEAKASLAVSYRVAVRLRAPMLRALVVSLASQGGVMLLARRAWPPASISTPREPRGLTAREREVLSCLAEGWTNRRMATALGISEKTVSVHIGNIKQKLGVEHRTEAAAVAIRLSLAEQH